MVTWRKLGLAMAFGSGLMAGPQVLADSLDLNLNDDAMRLTYEADMSQGMKGLALDAGYYYNDRLNASDADMVHVGLHVTGDNWSQSGVFNIKVGGRLIYTDLDPFDVMALGLGGEVRFSPVHRLGLGASAYYAPRIASFMDAERYSEYGVKIDYQLLTQAYVYVGYRQINVEVENISRKVELDDSGHVGLKLVF